ncbi:LamG domain-containing protein, partial [Patescibacteria group bacterium]
VADVSGQGNTGYLNGQTATTSVRGKLGQALDFDGDDDYVSIGDISVSEDGTYTYTGWFKYTSSTTNLWAVNESSTATNPLSGLILDGPNMRAFWRNDSGVSNNVVGSTTTNDNEWHFGAVVGDGVNIYLYVDGALDASPSSFVGGGQVITKSSIGALDRGGISNYIDAQADDVRIYDRALSADEVRQLYNAGESKFNTSKKTGLQDGLVGHWTFDGPDMVSNVADVSGQGNTGYLNGQTATTSVRGKLGQALEFDGDDDYVLIGDKSSLEGLSEASIEVWVKTTNNTSDGIIVSKGIGAGATYILWQDNIASISLRTNTFSFAVGSGAALSRVEGSANANSVNEWTHLVGVWTENPESIKLYVNGTLDQQNTTLSSVSMVSDTSLAIIGAYSDNSSNFNGALDNARIYNRALSADEVRQLYNAGESKFNTSKKTGLQDGLVGHWTFDGPDMVSNVADVSGQGNTGYLNGQTATTSVRGKLGQALEFDGVDDTVNIYDSVSLDITGAVAASFWMKLDSLPGFTDSIYLVGKGYVDGYASEYIYNVTFKGNGVGGADSDLFFYIGDGSSFSNIETQPNNWQVGTWYHVVSVWDGATDSGGMRFYIDGTLNNTGASSVSSIQSSNLDGAIGDDPDGTHHYFFDGTLDDVRIYNRALSEDEIRQLYNSGR